MFAIGAASKVINGELGAWVQGATTHNRADFIRDDLEANGLFLRNDSASFLLVSCDLGALETNFIITAREAMAAATGLEPRDIIIFCTHTHNGPSVMRTSFYKPLDEAYHERLREWLVALAKDAVAGAKPGRLGWGVGKAAIGYNRRCCWEDGSHSMHGDTTRPDFTGMEGPDDPQHTVVFAEDLDGRMLAVLHCNTAHPVCFYGRNFYSADYPGVARACLREALGPIPVLYANGAFGDINICSQVCSCPRLEDAEQKVRRGGFLAAGETLRLIHEASREQNPVLGHTHEDVKVTVRLPEPATLEKARKMLARAASGEEIKPAFDLLYAFGANLLQENFGENPEDTLAIHAVRIGGMAIISQPCELYCQFGLDTKRRSPATATAICGLADGFGGYCPTTSALIGGGYSAIPLNWCRLEEQAGYKMVDVAARLLHLLWKE